MFRPFDFSKLCHKSIARDAYCCCGAKVCTAREGHTADRSATTYYYLL